MPGDVIPCLVCLLGVFLVLGLSCKQVDARHLQDERFDEVVKRDKLDQLIDAYLDSAGFEDPSWPEKRAPSTRHSKRRCDLGIFSNGCRLQDMSDAVTRRIYLQSGDSPGKRSDLPPDFDLDSLTPTKRSCRFRLGGHCITEALDQAARQKEFLKSADSPGRRRRSLRGFLARRVR